LRGRREETYLDLLLAEFISEFGDCAPSSDKRKKGSDEAFSKSVVECVPCSNGLLELIEIVNEVSFEASINHDLIARADGEAGVVVGTKMHDTFASSRISLFVEGSGNRQFSADTSIQSGNGLQLGRVDVNSRGISTGRDVGAGGGGDTMLDVGPTHGIGMVGLDIEDVRNDVHIKPETSAEIRRLEINASDA